ncbi:MAG: PAS domain S-box protein [Pseudolabrys sp.]
MHKLLQKQLARATDEHGEIELAKLTELVAAAYDEADRDRQRTDRSISLMIEEIEQSHQRLLDAFDVIPEGIVIFDSNDRLVKWNKRYAELYSQNGDSIATGVTFEEILRNGLTKAFCLDALGREEEWLQERMAQHRLPSSSHEQRLIGDRWLKVEERRTADGGSIGVRIDITELKRREASFRLLFDANPVPMWIIDPTSSRFIAVNEATISHYGYSREQFLSMTAYEVRPASEHEEFREFMQSGQVSQGKRAWTHRKSDGTSIKVLVYGRALTYEGQAARLNAIIDVTQQYEAEQLLREQKRLTDAAINNMSHGLTMFDKDGRLSLVNDRYMEMFGLSPDTVSVGMTFRDLILHRHNIGQIGEDPAKYCGDLLRKIQNGESSTRVIELTDGRFIQVSNRPMSGGGWVATHNDITARVQNERLLLGARLAAERAEQEARNAEQLLMESEKHARDIVTSALDGFIQIDHTGLICEWNQQAEAIFGWSRDEAIGRAIATLIIPEEDRDRHNEGIRRFLTTGSSNILGRRIEVNALHRDGHQIKVELSITSQERQTGTVFNGFVRDLTSRIAAEDRLRQAQKMEAVGNLTGGLAHDFNNLLSIVIGNLDLVIESPNIDDATKEKLETVLQASERGATLTKRMLAFSRRQPLRTECVDINSQLQTTAQLLRRTLGENIECDLKLDPSLWHATTDPHQLETAIINISVNARDAMPGGGKLTISTRNVYASPDLAARFPGIADGAYAAIDISDTGTGMPPSVLARIFEPFFTTKDAGAGTGLGLSMVYGFVKQSGGYIDARSEPDKGTTFTLYLPKGREQSSEASDAPGADDLIASPPSTDTVILAVDDNPVVRSTLVNQLKLLGYKVIEAEDAASALKCLADEPKVDLLFTDVVMPGGLNGKDLARIAKETIPELKVLFTSGFPGTALSTESVLDENDLLLSKPYRKSELAQIVRRALAS